MHRESMWQRQLEQKWLRFQFDVAAVRGVLGPLYNAAFHARRAHTFLPGTQPAGKIVEAIMGATSGEPNGVPDGHAIESGAVYGARVASVMTASVVLLTIDGAIQEFASELGLARGGNMDAGDHIQNDDGTASERASTLIWAAANNIRHVDEWYRYAQAYSHPESAADRDRRDRQNRSMEPLARVLCSALPITDILSYEVLYLLAQRTPERCEYDRVELHALRIGQDLIARAGLLNAEIGVTILGSRPESDIPSIAPDLLTISDGLKRSASALPHTDRVREMKPPSEPTSGT